MVAQAGAPKAHDRRYESAAPDEFSWRRLSGLLDPSYEHYVITAEDTMKATGPSDEHG